MGKPNSAVRNTLHRSQLGASNFMAPNKSGSAKASRIDLAPRGADSALGGLFRTGPSADARPGRFMELAHACTSRWASRQDRYSGIDIF